MKSDASIVTSGQQIAVVALRTLIGWHFLYEGYVKLLPAWSRDGQPMPAGRRPDTSTPPQGRSRHCFIGLPARRGWARSIRRWRCCSC